jgi:hypothetical protein
MENIPTFGAFKSEKDKRTIKYNDIALLSIDYLKGGKEYLPEDVEHQHNVGICTAISLTMNRGKSNGKKYSADFQYLLQKRFYDGGWFEGSSLLNALKVGKKYGFLPVELFCDINGKPYITESDRFLTYAQYSAKLQSISNEEVDRLISLCVDKIGGYASVNVSNPYSVAKAITESESGLTSRFDVTATWWTNLKGIRSFLAKDISPLRKGNTESWGHAVTTSNFDFNIKNLFTLANSWGAEWARKGSADYDWENYKPTEMWLITKEPIIQMFDTDLKFGMSGDKVVNLQNALKIKGFFNYNSTGYFGMITWLAVKAYQKANGIISTGNCFILTRTKLNKDFNL